MFKYDDHYTVKKLGDDLMDHLVLTNKSKYPGVEYQYGVVKLIEEENSLRVNFMYEVFANPNNFETEDKLFSRYIGAILIEAIQQETAYAIELLNKGKDES